MRKHTKAFYGAFFVALLIAAPMMADARTFERGYGCGADVCYGKAPGWFQGMSDDKREALRTLMMEHEEKVQPIRDKYWVKKTTLKALEGNPNVKPVELSTLIEEMASLRMQLREERKAVTARVKQETGLELPFEPGFKRHRGMREAGFRHYGMNRQDVPGARHCGHQRGYPSGYHDERGSR